MRTAVTGTASDGGQVFKPTIVDLLELYGTVPHKETTSYEALGHES